MTDMISCLAEAVAGAVAGSSAVVARRSYCIAVAVEAVGSRCHIAVAEAHRSCCKVVEETVLGMA